MKLNDLISEIREYNPLWEPRYITHLVNINRALLLKNKLNQGITINDVIKQTLYNVPMTIVDNSQLYGFTTDSRLLRSKEPIPSLIAKNFKHSFLTVRNPKVMVEAFNVVSKESAYIAGNGRHNQRSVFCFLYDGYLWIKLKRENPKISLITTVTVEAVFEDPLEVMFYNNPNLIGRDYWWEEYPVSSADWVYIKNMILANGESKEENT